MNPTAAVPNAASNVSLATLVVASCNLLNLARPGRAFYPNQEPYDAPEFERKLTWLGSMFARLNADVVGVQEVWDEVAFKGAVGRSGLHGLEVRAPGAEGDGAQGTPRVGLVTRLAIEDLQSHAAFPAGHALEVPEVGTLARFERPVLQARLRNKQGRSLQVLVVHLKSKRPKFLQDLQGRHLEDNDDPAVLARATLRSLMMRAGEAAALRSLVVALTQRSHDPLILMGDMNDSPFSVTSQLVAAQSVHDKGARDTALFHAWDVQTEPALRRDMAYSHVHQGWPEMLDQVWVSEEFVATSRHAIGDVKRVEVFNDHLHESRERWRSDHGFVRALLRWRIDPPA